MMNDLEKDLNTALKQMLPDDMPERLDWKLDLLNAEPLDVPQAPVKAPPRKSIFYVLSSLAACLVLMIGLAGGHYYLNNLAVDTVVDIDVNPSIEISTNSHDRVLAATPINEDAKLVLDGIDLKNVDLNVAVNAVIGSMVRNGYLTPGQDNSILVSIRNNSAEKARSVRNLVLTDLSSSLSNNQVRAAVLNQTVKTGSQAKAFAKSNHISIGKAVLVLNLAGKDSSLDPEELASMSLKELAALVREKHLDISDIVNYDADDSIWENLSEAVDGVNEKDNALNQGLITAAAAKKLALDHAGIAPQNATFIKAALDEEDGNLVYEVEFISGNIEYEYNIHAATGQIVDMDTDSLHTGSRPFPQSDDEDDDDDNDEDEDEKKFQRSEASKKSTKSAKHDDDDEDEDD